NKHIEDPEALLREIEANYSTACESIDRTDGLSMSFGNWRFNIRMSNTEPVVRLNVESRGDDALMKEKTKELLAFMD
ncbi:MAG: phosphomannomutase CpsG, partial [Rhizobiaceae bacterium]|nr:phosphomannomutase CpsG [Rhizobiaceae bacterium]